MRLRAVDRVVHPALGLLHAELAPLHLGQQAPALREALGELLRERNVPAEIVEKIGE